MGNSSHEKFRLIFTGIFVIFHTTERPFLVKTGQMTKER